MSLKHVVGFAPNGGLHQVGEFLGEVGIERLAAPSAPYPGTVTPPSGISGNPLTITVQQMQGKSIRPVEIVSRGGGGSGAALMNGEEALVRPDTCR